ncbi:MAG TPA: 50S ribosomal protein L7/L12 [Erysipelothrix sp.]|nr:50S ribosomal protein L7/L12 [Erysipelothrix sp.]
MAKLTSEELISSLKEMTILELNELVKAIEEEFGVSASAPVAAAAAADVVDEGPSEVSVIVTGVSGSKVGVIKALREITGLGMMEAKALVDNAPSPIKENISPADAEALKAQLIEAGAEVEVK